MIGRVAVLAAARHPVRAPFAGGLESITWHLVEGLRRRGVPVTLFAAPGSDPRLRAEPLRVAPLELSDTARADVAMTPEAELREHHAYLQVMLTLARGGVDVVHNNSLHYLPPSMAEFLPVPMVMTLHTPPTPWLEPAARLARGARIRYAAVSDATRRLWAGIVDADVVPNGVDVDRWRPGAGGDGLVWFGRLVPEKAPDLAIAMARAAGRTLRLAGPRSDPEYFRERVEPLLGDDVTWVGHLDTEQLGALIGSSAAALVTPRWDEPYGLVAAEALACGTPVLAVARGGLPEVLGPDCGVLVAPGPDDEVVARGAALVDSVVGLSRTAARSHAARHCSLDVMIGRYLALYEEETGRRKVVA